MAHLELSLVDLPSEAVNAFQKAHYLEAAEIISRHSGVGLADAFAYLLTMLRNRTDAPDKELCPEVLKIYERAIYQETVARGTA